jgi:Ni,Fe-hydrogenase III small subunit
MKSVRLKLVDRRDRWGLTLQGWLFGITLVVALLWSGLSQVHDFFAMNQPLQNPDLLIVEGWITDENTKDALEEFRSKPSYKTIVTTGTQLPRGYYLSEYKTFADLSRASLLKMGMPASQVIAVPAPGVPRDRSYTAAVALSQWLKIQDLGYPIKGANLLSESVHSRRSWMLFKKAIAGQLELGVLSVPTAEYDGKNWWKQSEGFKRVLFESIAWVYVTFFNKTE